LIRETKKSEALPFWRKKKTSPGVDCEKEERDESEYLKGGGGEFLHGKSASQQWTERVPVEKSGGGDGI